MITISLHSRVVMVGAQVVWGPSRPLTLFDQPTIGTAPEDRQGYCAHPSRGRMSVHKAADSMPSTRSLLPYRLSLSLPSIVRLTDLIPDRRPPCCWRRSTAMP